MNRKKRYIKPKITKEKIYETASLACGKCQTGPINQLACRTLRRRS